jgi:cobyrinic acid a,c-diamide synthase
MGVFDGFSYTDEEGSTAQIAKLIGAPALLVLDVGKMARSAGALALGYTQFDPAFNVAGFILNRCGSEQHYQGVRQSVEQATGRPVVGWLPKDTTLHIPERHLGLVPTDERGELSEFVERAAGIVEQYFDLDGILTLASSSPLPRAPEPHIGEVLEQQTVEPVVIGVARDAAFSFYYEDNLDLLRENNARIAFFSPQHDTLLPLHCAGLYLGGGFPEVYAGQLAANQAMLAALRQAHAAGMPIYAECGGFMYLTEAIVDLEGRQHPMVGLAPGVTYMQPRLVSLGYRLVESPQGNFLLPKGVTTRGHEFHWSTWDYSIEAPAWHIRPRAGAAEVRPDGYAAGNLVASYVHLHFAHDDRLARNFVVACQRWSQHQASS